MNSKQAIVDVDAHYLEAMDELVAYIDDDNPIKRKLSASNPGSLFPASTGDILMSGTIKREEVSYPDDPMEPEEVETVMQHLGLDKTILLSQKMLRFSRIRADDERAVVIANAYVDFMLDQVVDPERGIYTVVPVPYHDPEATVELIDRVADEPGIVGICMVTAGPEPPLGDRRYDPIYQAAQDADLPIIFHAGGSSLDDFYIRGYEDLIETHTLGFLWSNMAQLTSIVVQGVPEKFPDLEFVFQESGIFWVPLMMYRLDAEYLKRRSEAPLLEKLPSEYIKEFYFGIQPLEHTQNEKQLQHIIEMLGGPDRLMYASDYPHWDYDRPSVITDIGFLSQDEKESILGRNAEEVFGI